MAPAIKGTHSGVSTVKNFICGVAFCALFGLAQAAQATTIVKLNLGSVGPDIAMNAGGVISTMNDGNAGTVGDQNTDIEFTGFLDPLFADLNTNAASFSLSGPTATGPASVLGSLVIQNFSGGQFNLFAPDNSLLLQGSLLTSSLTGVIGPPGTGSIFTTTLGTMTGGSLLPYIVPGSASLSINLSNVNGGNGFSVSGGTTLGAFLSDATVSISGDSSGVVPEPSALVLLALGTASLMIARRRKLADQ
jgi:hypothetical protein